MQNSSRPYMHMRYQDWGLMICLAFMWGSNFAFNEKLLEQLPPITIVWLRQFFNCIFFLLIALPHLKSTQWSNQLLWRLGFLGIIGVAIPFSMFSIGQQYITSVLAGIGNGATPLFTLIWAAIFLNDERFTTKAFVGVAIGFSGIVILFWPLIAIKDFASAGGLLIVTCAAGLYGYANVFIRFIPKVHLTIQGLGVNLSACLVLSPALFWEHVHWDSFTLEGVGYSVSQSFLSSTGVLIFLFLISRVGSVNASMVSYLMPFATLLFGIVWLEESVTPWAIGGLSLVLMGMWIKDGSRKSAPTK